MGVIISGHFVYTSGLHGEKYFDKDVLILNPMRLSHACHLVAEMFSHDGVEAVAAPAYGGIALSQWVAFHSRVFTNQPVISIYAQKTASDKLTLRPKLAETIRGKRTLVMEDTINTGETAQEMIALVRSCGGDVIGVGALCARQAMCARILDVPKFHSLIMVDWNSWKEGECPLCEKGEVPIDVSVGHGREFLARKDRSG